MGQALSTPSKWQEVSARKRADREAILARHSEWRVPDAKGQFDISHLPLTKLTERERMLVHCDATALADLIQKQIYTSEEVITAYAKAAVVAQDLTNCLSEIFILDGIKRARQLDHILKETGKVVGPLHGVPISVKDHIKVKGVDTSTGYVSWAYKTVADENANIVNILTEAGAVLYVKTQNPQTLMSLETNNNIFGRVTNPFNRNLTPGGSSGGESALIACHGSPIGLGTDIGGSIRIPAAHCGLYGLKCSVGRLPHDGLLGSHEGMDAIVGCLGPIATSARDLELFCRVALSVQPWLYEPPLLAIPWKADVARGENLPDKLCIGILFDDGVVAPHPPIAAALRRYKAALIAAGHDVINWQPLDHQLGWDLIVKLYFLDGGAEYRNTLRRSGEPATQQTHWVLSHVAGHGPFKVDEIFNLNSQRDRFRTKALAHWNSTQERTAFGRPVDVILCPAAPTLAPPHDKTLWWGYSSYWNLLDLPAVIFPVGKFTSGEQLDVEKQTLPRSDVEALIQKQWDPKAYENAPIALQLVGRRLHEEKLLAILDVLERVMKKE